MTWYKSLHAAKGRETAGVFLAEGPKVVRQIAATNPGAIQEILIDESSDYCESFTGNIRLLTSRQFHTIAASKTPQGVAAVLAIPSGSMSAELPEKTGDRVLFLEEIQDPGNVGTLIRTAAAFNFSGVILSETSADPFAPKAVQASVGAVLSLWIRRTSSCVALINTLKNNGFCLAAADIDGIESYSICQAEKVLLALGNEGKGLSKPLLSLADTVFKIPYNNQAVESLNVAAAGAIAMYCVDRGK